MVPAKTAPPAQGAFPWGPVKIAAILLTVLVIPAFVITLLFPPFQSSPAAGRIVRSTEAIARTIDGELDQNRQMLAEMNKLADGALDTCRARIKDRSDKQKLADCFDDAVQAASKQDTQFEQSLYAAKDNIAGNLKSLKNASDASDGFIAIFYDQLKRLLKWLGPSVAAVIIAAIALSIALTRRSFWAYFKGSASLSLPGGLAIKFDNIDAYRAAIGERYFDLDKEISRTYRVKLAEQNMETAFGAVKQQIDAAFLGKRGIALSQVPHRATLYVPGFLGDELVEATGYVGHGFAVNTNVVGRRYSVRYSIVGMSWRLRSSLYGAEITNDHNDLVRNWGFTNAESSRIGAGRASVIAFAIRSDQADSDPLGIIYMQAFQAQAFGAGLGGTIDADGLYPDDVAIEQLWNSIARTRAVKDLVASLTALRGQLRWDDKIVEEHGK